MIRLIQLPNGNWVNHKLVISVKAVRGRPGMKEAQLLPVPDYVSIRYSSTSPEYENIDCDSYEQAVTMRDDIASRVNPK